MLFKLSRFYKWLGIISPSEVYLPMLNKVYLPMLNKEAQAMDHPIPLVTKKNILLAMRQMSTYTGDVQAARRKIIERAKEIDASYLIPANWNEDGTVSDRIKIVILDGDEVFISREQADRLEENGDMATYRMSRDELMSIIDPEA